MALGRAATVAISVIVTAIVVFAVMYAAIPPTAAPVTTTRTETRTIGAQTVTTTVTGAATTVTRTETRTTTATVTGEVKPVKIGFTLPLTGPVAADGEMIKRGVDLTEIKVNEEGGVLGRPVELIYYDDGYEVEKITLLYERLVTQDKVDILLGPFATYATAVASPISEKYKMPMFTYWGSNPEFYDGSKFHYLVSYDQPKNTPDGWNDVVKVFENWERWGTGTPKPESVVMLFIDTPYGVANREGLPPKWEAIGIKSLSFDLHGFEVMDFTPLITRYKALNPDIVMYAGYFAYAVQIQKQWVEQGGNTDFFINELASMPEWFPRPELGGVTPEVAEGTISYAGFVWTRHMGWGDWFIEEYQKKYGDLPSWESAILFNAVELAVKAYNMAGTFDADKLLETLNTNIISTGLFDVLRDPVGGANKLGVTADGETTWGAGQWQNGEWEFLWPPEIATSNRLLEYTAG